MPDQIDSQAMADAAVQAAQVLRALSNPTRLLLLCQLVEAERSVGDLELLLGLPQAYVSQQLSRLRGEGIVAARREGRLVFYRLADPRVTPVLETLYRVFCAEGAGLDARQSGSADLSA